MKIDATRIPTRAARRRRGLTLIELMLALSITALIAGGISAMVSAVDAGTETRADQRTAMVSAGVLSSRLAGYVEPARCILKLDDSRLTLWLHDNRTSETVHASEIRWINFDDATGAVSVDFLAFPDDWPPAAIDAADVWYPADTNWDLIHTEWDALGHIATMPIGSGLSSFTFSLDDANATLARLVTFSVGFPSSDTQEILLQPAFAVRTHYTPK